MYCYYLNRECGVTNYEYCINSCKYWDKKSSSIQQFNYECPDCHGRFNQPSIPAVTSSLFYKCPFCGRIMEGLS